MFQIISSVAVLSIAECAYKCRVRDDPYMNIGCTISEASINGDSHDIELSTWGPNQTEAEMEWIILEDCRLATSPKLIFEAFEKATEAYIKNSEGLKTLSVPFFGKQVTKAVIIFTDLEVIEENAFKGLSNITRLDLDHNTVRTIHKNAFKDLTQLKQIDLKYNKLESLDDELFNNNVNLEKIFLLQNDIKVINAQLFSTNTELVTLDLDGNSIVYIEEGFITNLINLKVLGLRYNICVDVAIDFTQETCLEMILKECYANFKARESKL